MFSKNNNSNQNRHIKKSDTDRNYDTMEKYVPDSEIKTAKRKPFYMAEKEKGV